MLFQVHFILYFYFRSNLFRDKIQFQIMFIWFKNYFVFKKELIILLFIWFKNYQWFHIRINYPTVNLI